MNRISDVPHIDVNPTSNDLWSAWTERASFLCPLIRPDVTEFHREIGDFTFGKVEPDLGAARYGHRMLRRLVV